MAGRGPRRGRGRGRSGRQDARAGDGRAGGRRRSAGGRGRSGGPRAAGGSQRDQKSGGLGASDRARTAADARSGTRQRVRRAVEPSVEDIGGFRSGYVALVGRPNVGKSTLLNHLLGMKLAATTHKPQTTRRNLLGILHPPGAQLLLLDTPGYHQAKGPLNRYMVEQAKRAIDDADVIGYVVEARGMPM